MYPATYFGLFPAFPRGERGFVAMSFDPRFDARWTNVIAPAINSIEADGKRLAPHRVDLRTAGDSILTEILDNIARCRIFVADISAIGEIDGNAIRNANVLYEVGLAHAVRQPEEVILVRSDDQSLGFDIANVRVHRYDPDGAPDKAKDFLADRILQGLQEVDMKKLLAIRSAVESLDYNTWRVLSYTLTKKSLNHPVASVANFPTSIAIRTLLDLGAIKTVFVRPTEELLSNADGKPEELFTYQATEFGLALIAAVGKEQGIFEPEMREMIKRLVLGGAPADGGS